MNKESVKILLVEDNPGDIELTKEAFIEAKFTNDLLIARDGEEALDFLFKRNNFKDAETPDIILLDLNLPKIDGREVLEEIKQSQGLKHIPVIILTSSQAEKDVLESYNLNANCYIVKPFNTDSFADIVKSIEHFWIEIVRLPSRT